MRFRSSIFSSERPGVRFAWHVAFFVAATMAAQTLIYIASGGDRTLPDEIQALRNSSGDGTSVLYYGDSVVTTLESQSPDMKTLPDLVAARLPNVHVTAVTHRAYHPGVYLSYGRYLAHRSHPPRIWIIPINLRSFSAGWDLRPEYQFPEELLLTTHESYLFRVFLRPLEVFKVFDLVPIKQQDFLETPVYDGERLAGRVQDFFYTERFSSDHARIMNTLVFNYMYGLRPEHRKVRQLVDLCRILKEHGLVPLFYITPVDVETGEQVLGERFKKRIADNVEVLKRELAQAGAAPLDLSTMLPSSAFNWREGGAPNEHLTQAGRIAVADRLSHWIRENPAALIVSELGWTVL